MSQRKPITPAGYKRLEDELHGLWHHDRPRVVQEVSDAAAHGDRSENAEYVFGKKKLRESGRRIRYLSGLLERLDVVPPSANASDYVQFGATVLLEDEDGKKRRYQLVGEDEVDAKAGRISMKSPMGQALLKKRRGDYAVVSRPAGDLELLIEDIRYE